ncbi:titin homolog [Cydia fagiglandana]|uniref:titin homolog n=1 Tax=Cydia fagiglandana TaxID=1458189 RepID=UPI002FEDF518
MGKGDPCGVCGETRTRLVDGFFYCVECGTQDTNVQETVVEHQALADGTFTIARRSRYSIKIKEGVEMSPEWYKWHKSNFLLAGLTELLIELGAAPSVRMKVLWIWSRYIKMFQKREAMGPNQVLKQLEVGSSSSEAEAEEAEGEELGPRSLQARALRVDRVTNYVVVAILALALNFDRSPILVSHFLRLLRWRLLPVADKFRFVPAEVLAGLRGRRAARLAALPLDCNPLTVFHYLPVMMCRVSRLLALGGPLTPDVAGVLRAQLRELRLPSALAAVVCALMDLLPVPFKAKTKLMPKEKLGGDYFPDYETTVMAYIVVALKMCFGLDDDRERRLSDAVDLINEEAGHPLAYGSAPEPTARLFSFLAWAAHLRLRAALAARHAAPLAWARARRGADDAAMEHFTERAGERRHDPDKSETDVARPFLSTTSSGPVSDVDSIKKGAKARLTDQVTMEILDRIPKRYEVGVPSLEELRPAMASREPQTAIARAIGHLLPAERRKLLDEDFTQYSLEYAYRHLALPSPPSRHGKLFRGVRVKDGRGRRLGDAVYSSLADATPVYVKDCANRHWARAARPAAAHVRAPGDAPYRSPDTEHEKENDDLETFVEEDEGTNIFDDDFCDMPIKDEKPDSKDDIDVDETKRDINWGDDVDNFESAGVEDDADECDVFDSDDEVEPRFDPDTFDRKEVIKEMMAAAYRDCHVPIPARYLPLGEKPTKKMKKTYPSAAPIREYVYGIGTQYWANRLKKREDAAKVEDLVAAYRGNLHNDVLHQVEERVRAFTNANESADVIEPATELADPSRPADGNAVEDRDVDESRDVEFIENEAKNYKSNDEDSCEEHAYDPVLKNDADFDEKTHDVEQLYVKLKELPPEAERAASPDDQLTAILDQTIRQMKHPKIKKKGAMIIKTDINHLVDDPKRITRFNYWFTLLYARPKDNKHFLKSDRRLEKEFEENSSRSFWFVLKECSAVLDISPLRLYRLVTEIEKQMLKLLPKNQRKGNEPKKMGRPPLHKPRLDEYPKKKRGRPRKHMDKNLSGESGLHCRPERLRKDLKNASASQSQDRPRKLGEQRKTLNGNLSESSDSQEWRPDTLSEDSEDSSTSEDQDQPRKRGRPRKPLDKNTSENNNNSQRSSKNLKESSTSKNQDKPRKRGRPRKTLGKIILDDSDSDSQDLKPRRSSNDLEDATITQNQDLPRNRGIPRKTFDGNHSNTSDSGDTSPERPRKNSNTSQNRPRKRVKLPKHSKENLISDTSDPQDCNFESSEDSSTLHNRRRKREKPLKLLDETPSDDSDSQQSTRERSRKYLGNSTSQDQDPSRKQGRHLKFLNDSVSEDSYSPECQQERFGTLSGDIDDESALQNHYPSRKQVKPLKFSDESVSEDSDSPECQQERFGTLSGDIEDESASQNHYPPRKPVKPLKFSDKSLSEESDSQHWRSERLDKASEAKSISQNQDQPRKHGRTLRRSSEISNTLDSRLQDDNNTSQNQEHPSKRGRPPEYVDEDTPDVGASQRSTPERSSAYFVSGHIEGESTYLDSTHIDVETASQNQEQPRKRGRPRKYIDGKPIGGKLQNPEQPRKRGRPRKYVDGKPSGEKSQKSNPQDERASRNQEHPRKGGRNTPQNQEHPKKRVIPRLRKSLERNVSEDSNSDKSSPERLRTYSDSSLQEGEGASQKQEYQRERRRPLKSLDEDHSEASASQRSTPEKSSIYLDSSHEGYNSPSRNEEPPRKRRRPRKSTDGSVIELCASKKGSPERCSKFDLSLQDQSASRPHQNVAGNPPRGNISKRSTPERSSTYLSSRLLQDSSALQSQKHPRKSWGESSLLNRTSDIASTDMNSSLQEDNNASNNQAQPRKRNRASKSMDGSLLEAGASQKTTPRRKQSGASIYLKVGSRSQKEKYPGTKPVQVTLSEVVNILQERRPERVNPSKYVEDPSDSQNKAHPSKQGKPCKSMDFPKISTLHREPERPSPYLNWKPLENASTPQNQGHPNKPERFSKYVERNLPDISAIQEFQGSSAEPSLLRNKREEYSETKVISFDQF